MFLMDLDCRTPNCKLVQLRWVVRATQALVLTRHGSPFGRGPSPHNLLDDNCVTQT